MVQGDAFNRSSIKTVVCVGVTSNLKWADAPGNVLRDFETHLHGLSVLRRVQLLLWILESREQPAFREEWRAWAGLDALRGVVG